MLWRAAIRRVNANVGYSPAMVRANRWKLIAVTGSLVAACGGPDPVVNAAPTANIGADSVVHIGDTVALSGLASSDENGDPLTFGWTLESKPPGSRAALSTTAAPRVRIAIDAAGSYVVALVVSDGELSSAPARVTLTAENRAPVADAGSDQSVGAGAVVKVDGTASTDPDGDALTYRWTMIIKPAASAAVFTDATTATTAFTADVDGTYAVELVVNDGAVDSAPAYATIISGNAAPVANAGPDQRENIGSTIHLDGSGSSDPEGEPVAFSWTITMRPAGSTAMLTGPDTADPTFVVDAIGTYDVTLVVTDSVGGTDSDVVKIFCARNTRPVADAGPDLTAAVVTLVTLDGSGSADADGDPLTYSWRVSAAPPGASTGLANAGTVSPQFIPDTAGAYQIELVVNDGSANSLPDLMTVTATVRGTPSGFVRIPAGAFTMGGGSFHSHPVRITRAFMLSATEVTQSQWEALMGAAPSHFHSCGLTCPVENVSWHGAVAFLNAMSARDGYQECYDSTFAFEGLDCTGYRLPTEAEWEYAARAGTTTALHNGDIIEAGCVAPDPTADVISWHCGNSNATPHPVGEKIPNPWGLFDIHGNVFEWVHDWFGADYYLTSPLEDPLGPAVGTERIARGGAFAYPALPVWVRAGSAGVGNQTTGFRVARTAP